MSHNELTNEDLNLYSDCYKDEHGFRPSLNITKADYDAYFSNYNERFAAARKQEEDRFVNMVTPVKGWFKKHETAAMCDGRHYPIYVACTGEEHDGEGNVFVVIYDTYTRGGFFWNSEYNMDRDGRLDPINMSREELFYRPHGIKTPGWQAAIEKRLGVRG